jgi:chemotaxis protein histidine kinase CheA
MVGKLEMAEPIIDLSEIIDLYKEDAKRMIEKMKSALERWEEVKQGGAARAELRRLSHQLRGSGRTYGFRSVTRTCKAIENIILQLDKAKVAPDERVQESIRKKLKSLVAVFKEA